MTIRAALLLGLAAAIVPGTGAHAGRQQDVDLSQCANCAWFPDEWLQVDATELLDLHSLPPERRLDFLIGEWELLFPYENAEEGRRYSTEMPVGFDVFEWFADRRVLSGLQEWPFTSGGEVPFRAKTDFRYIEAEDRWQMMWMTGSSTGVYTGGLESDGVIAFYEHELTGDRRHLQMRPAMRYVFRNITADRFLVESYFSDDGGATFSLLQWRVIYRRRTPRQ